MRGHGQSWRVAWLSPLSLSVVVGGNIVLLVVRQLRYRLTTHIGDALVNGTLTREMTNVSDEMLERFRFLRFVR
jgi:hypothetical protein